MYGLKALKARLTCEQWARISRGISNRAVIDHGIFIWQLMQSCKDPDTRPLHPDQLAG